MATKCTLASSLAAMSLLIVALDAVPPSSDRGVFKRSFSWFKSKPEEEPVTVAPVVPDALASGLYPVWKVHKYNGIELRPLPEAAPPITATATAAATAVNIPASLEEHHIRAINDFVSFLPEDRLNVFELRSIGPYINLIPEDSIETLQLALRHDGIKEKSKLRKIIDLLKYIKELKLKPVYYIRDKLFGKKPELVQVQLPPVQAAAPLPGYVGAISAIPEPAPAVVPAAINLPINYPLRLVGTNSYVNVQTPKPNVLSASSVATAQVAVQDVQNPASVAALEVAASPLQSVKYLPSPYVYTETHPIATDILAAASNSKEHVSAAHYDAYYQGANENFAYPLGVGELYAAASELSRQEVNAKSSNNDTSTDVSDRQVSNSAGPYTTNKEQQHFNPSAVDGSFVNDGSNEYISLTGKRPIYVYPSPLAKDNEGNNSTDRELEHLKKE